MNHVDSAKTRFFENKIKTAISKTILLAKNVLIPKSIFLLIDILINFKRA